MSMRRICLTLSAVALTFQVGAGPDRLQYVEPSKLESIGYYDSLVVATGERVVIAPNGLPAGHVTYVVCNDWSETVDAVSVALRLKFALAESSRHTSDARPKLYGWYSVAQRREAELRRKALTDRGIDVSSFREAALRTKAYNRRDSEGSELLVRIADGTAILGSQSTIVVLSRTDSSYEQVRLFHFSFALPFEDLGQLRLVTETETRLMDKALEALGDPKVGVTAAEINADPFSLIDAMTEIASISTSRCGQLTRPAFPEPVREW